MSSIVVFSQREFLEVTLFKEVRAESFGNSDALLKLPLRDIFVVT